MPAILTAKAGGAEVRGGSLGSGAAAGSGSAAGAGGGAGGVAGLGGGVEISIRQVEADFIGNAFSAGQVAGGLRIVGAAMSSNGRGNRRGGSRWMQEVRSHVQHRLQHGRLSAVPSAPVALLST
jgi:hypothetical protein